MIDQQAHADRVGCCFASEREALLRFAVSMVGPDHAQDIVATALTSVLERRSSPPIIDMRSFLFRTVHNAANPTGEPRTAGFVGNERSSGLSGTKITPTAIRQSVALSTP